ncbi:MAG: response regulator [Methylococcaceae bacterium]|nr:response regulator [Methylococcaceae bacterium]
MQEGGGTVRLLTYRELLLTLQKLCKEKRTGMMFIKNEAGESAKLNLEKGVVFDVKFKGETGEAALALIKEIKQGKATFSTRLGTGGGVEKKIALSTVQIFQILTSNIASVTKKPQAPVTPAPAAIETPEPIREQPSVAQQVAAVEAQMPEDTSPVGEWGMIVIEAQLAAIIGPVAKVVFLDYIQEVHAANDFKALNAVIEKISKTVLTPEQQKLFRQAMLSFISQYNLKGHDSILEALKSSDKKLRLNNSAVGLCVDKHALHGEFGMTLINKLVLQVEQAGNLGKSVSLLAVLQLLEKSDKTGLLEVREKGKVGGFYFDKGVLINAVECGMNGKIIAMDILQWEHDYMVFRAVAQKGVSRQIHQTVDVLAKDVERLKENDKLEGGGQVSSPKYTNADKITLIAKAIGLTEGCDSARAENILTDVLKDYDQDFKGWLWLSRVLTNMTAIEIALKKAAHIHSKNADLAEDVRKFSQARKTIRTDFVLRCPFCWMPIAEKDSECTHCKSSFFIDPSFFKTVGKAKFEILDKAIERYSNVLQKDEGKEKHIYLRFYLAMAYLNRKYFQEGSDQLNEIARLGPQNHALITQGRILRDYMNAEGLNSGTVEESLNANLVDGSEKNARILIVEDSLVTRKVIARTLMANGYEIFEAKNAFEALTGLEEKKPQLILLDIILPGKDGYEILEEIRQKPSFKKTPVIMLTSRDGLFDKLKGKVSDANEYLTKPFQPDELLTVVRKYLR